MNPTALRQELERTMVKLKSNIASIRTNRASPALVENLEVDYFGTKTPLKALAAISTPNARELLIQPWDKNSLPLVEKAIQNSGLGLAPIAERDLIRLAMPQLTEERRRELLKLLGRELEDARIRVRRDREDTLRDVDRRFKAKEISEDERFRSKNEIQKIVDEFNKKIEEIGAGKEKEIMTV